ncbi:antibiotic biosynthesis monooxygenase [Micromonospora musae]|uniref:antibiotic biosynthesis monooxygenase n=1 Tax=Micromonospora musae TaxID=1894970 RepID=UPI0033F13A9B
MPTVELTRFRVDPARENDLLQARPQMLADFQADRSGFIEARLVRLPNDEWLDIVLWESPEDFAESRAKGANLPGIAAFFDAIGALISAEEGTSV